MLGRGFEVGTTLFPDHIEIRASWFHLKIQVWRPVGQIVDLELDPNGVRSVVVPVAQISSIWVYDGVHPQGWLVSQRVDGVVEFLEVHNEVLYPYRRR